ncbi:MAG: GMC family oxidoreductase [Verrucomicrobia bacterium]|nr:GMC family oxidoreductase [Verrucomicrobiota bacterium]
MQPETSDTHWPGYDVCVIGAGPAGIALALELAKSPLRICLLESGGTEPSRSAQSLNSGEKENGFLNDSLTNSRSRIFGGTSFQWAGYCSPIENGEFEQNPEITPSGWPIKRSELDPYYAKAEPILDLPSVAGKHDEDIDAIDWARYEMEWRLYKKSPPTRFLAKYLDPILKAENIDLLLNTTYKACSLSNRQVTHIVADRGGEDITVEAKLFILATGGIEATREILLLREDHKPLLDKTLQAAGLYFCVHPHFFDGQAILMDELAQSPLLDPATDGGTPIVLQIPPAVRKRKGLEPVIFRFERVARPDQVDSYFPTFLNHLRQRPFRLYGRFFMQASMRLWDQSRISLSKQKDPFGMPRVKVGLRVHPASWRSMEASLQMVIRGLGMADKARLRFPDAFFNDSRHASKGFTSGHHHMCSTRMADSPENGVVDSDLKVFGLDNLYVCAASVFSTTGADNPTMTIVALALRLANHIGQVV